MNTASLDDHHSGVPCDVTLGETHETALTSSIIFAFQVDDTCIHCVKLKWSCYNHDKDWSDRFCYHNTLGLVWTVCPIPQPNRIRIGLAVRICPHALWLQDPSRTGLNPLNNNEIFLEWSIFLIRCSKFLISHLLEKCDIISLQLYIIKIT